MNIPTKEKGEKSHEKIKRKEGKRGIFISRADHCNSYHGSAVGVLAPQYLSYIHKAKVAADQANLKNYYTEIQLDYASTGVYNPQVPLVD